MRTLRHPLPFGLLLLALLGVVAFLLARPGPAASPEGHAPAPQAGPAFDPADTGTITGRATWEGPPPDAPTADNPRRPRIHPDTRGLAEAVVYLRGIDPSRSRAWDHPPVTV